MRKSKPNNTSLPLLLGASALLPSQSPQAVDVQLHAYANFRPRVEVIFTQQKSPIILIPAQTTTQTLQPTPGTLLVLVY